MRKIVLVAHNLRSCHNVGSLLRTADGLGISKVYLTGYTPYPLSPDDERLPHLSRKIHQQIQKTALGAEQNMEWEHNPDVTSVLAQLRKEGCLIAALEQDEAAQPLPDWKPAKAIALLVGSETTGIEPETIKLCDLIVEIPMAGKKESFNVVQAAAMALYHARFTK